jgi:hypothetical protein
MSAVMVLQWDTGSKTKSKKSSPSFEIRVFHWLKKKQNGFKLVEMVKIIKPKLDMYIS